MDVVVAVCVGVRVGEGGLVEVVVLQAALSSTGRSERTSEKADFLIGSILAQMTAPDPGANG